MVLPAVTQDSAIPGNAPPGAQPTPGAAEALYLQLSRVGLDEARVFRVREATLNESAMHVTFEDGTIAFTKDVAGKITGAFFEGEGELLLQPPSQVERSSLMLFTGAAILEERFSTAYFRFNDGTFEDLQPFLRAVDNPREFISEWDETARNLAGADALRLLVTLSNSLPVSGDAKEPPESESGEDVFFHARVQGRKLGPFDVHFDTRAPEQVWAGQSKTVGGLVYYDTWTSFSPVPPGGHPRPGSLESETASDVISVTSHKIRTEIKLPKSISAEARLQMEVHQGGARTLLFELSRFLQVKQVEADGKALEFIHNPAVEGTQLARRGNDVVAVVFPRPLRSGQRVELRFVYGGDVLSEAGGGLLYVGARGTWYPNRDSAMSNFDLEFRYPAEWTLLATGKRRVEERPEKTADAVPAGEQYSHWVSERPIPVAGFNLGKYRRATANAGKIAVETYAALGVERSFPTAPPEVVTTGPGNERLRKPQTFVLTSPPPSPARNAQAVADISARAVDFFSRCYGPYPYSALFLTQNPGTVSQGWPGLIFLSSYSFLNDEEKSQLRLDAIERTISSGVIAHETAHQWWGDLVGWQSYHDQWIVEALANYSSLMLMESTDPRQFQAAMDKYRDDLLRKNKDDVAVMDAGPVTLGARLTNSHFPQAYEAVSYGRGTWLLHMLRCMMRDAEVKSKRSSGDFGALADEPFVRALRKLRERYEGKQIDGHDLLHALEDELPRSLWHEGEKSLDWFYTGWINGTAVPRVGLHDVKFSDAPGGTVVTGTISQSDSPETLVTPVPVYAVAGNRTVFVGRVFVDGAEAQFRLTAPRGARKVVVDPNQTLLARH